MVCQETHLPLHLVWFFKLTTSSFVLQSVMIRKSFLINIRKAVFCFSNLSLKPSIFRRYPQEFLQHTGYWGNEIARGQKNRGLGPLLYLWSAVCVLVSQIVSKKTSVKQRLMKHYRQIVLLMYSDGRICVASE